VVTLATSVLAAFGFRRLRAGPSGRLAWLALPLALGEFVQVPLATSPARAPAFLATVAADRDDYAVLEVPAGLEHRQHLYHQAVHGKRILLGYIARVPRASRAFVDALPLLADPAGWDLARRRPGEAFAGERYLRQARALGIRYAFVYRDLYPAEGGDERFARAIRNLLALGHTRLEAREPGFAAVRIDPPPEPSAAGRDGDRTAAAQAVEQRHQQER
jgi:hypothetical protein